MHMLTTLAHHLHHQDLAITYNKYNQQKIKLKSHIIMLVLVATRNHNNLLQEQHQMSI